MKTDVLIIGNGIAGLYLALECARSNKELSVTLITKAERGETNTMYAQGGIAAVMDNEFDNFENHIQDTLNAGAGLCDEKIVRTVVENAPAMINRLEDFGINLDSAEAGKYDLGKEGGHSRDRIVHHKDQTGAEIEKMLLAQIKNFPRLKFLQKLFAIDLLKSSMENGRADNSSGNICSGALVRDLESGQDSFIHAKITILAAGGIGQVYNHTTNSKVATGDGIAMAHRAGAEIKGMEFIQFHPTALFAPKSRKTFLITEALRGKGAELQTPDGKAFMKDYDASGSLATRDIVSRAINDVMKKFGCKHVWLDCSMIDKKTFEVSFPTILKKCSELGIKLPAERIPVVPSVHYLCGGIATNEWGQTTVENLFACGECAHTGMHGANRLASNSLLEAIVFAQRIAGFIAKNIKNIPQPVFTKPEIKSKLFSTKTPLAMKYKRDLKEIMTEHAGISRTVKNMRLGIAEINELKIKTEELMSNNSSSYHVLELRNMIQVGILILQQSLARTANIGCYYNSDYDQTRSSNTAFSSSPNLKKYERSC